MASNLFCQFPETDGVKGRFAGASGAPMLSNWDLHLSEMKAKISLALQETSRVKLRQWCLGLG
jgi:hypothetical protein